MNEWKVKGLKWNLKKSWEGLHFNFFFFFLGAIIHYTLVVDRAIAYTTYYLSIPHLWFTWFSSDKYAKMVVAFFFFSLLVEWVTARWHINDTLLIRAYNPTVILPSLKFFTNALVHFKIYNKIYNIIYIYNLNTIDSYFYILLTL